MGSRFSRAVNAYFARNERRLLLVGLDGAGKSTILGYLRRRKGTGKALAVTKPGTADFDVETIKHQHLTLHLWDVKGQDQMRPYWRHYYTGTQGVVFVIDASDKSASRLDAAAVELKAIAADEQLNDVAILIVANKNDIAGSYTPTDLSKILQLPRVLAGHPWHVQATVATTGEGIAEGLAFLANNMKPL